MFRSDEGRGYRRYVSGNWKQVLIRKYPNKETSRTTSWIHKEERANPVNWNILVTGGKESKSDSQSSGERNGNSLNGRSWRTTRLWDQNKPTMTHTRNETAETCTIDGESPVVVSMWFSTRVTRDRALVIWLPSSMGHVKSRMNLRGPPRKAKYS